MYSSQLGHSVLLSSTSTSSAPQDPQIIFVFALLDIWSAVYIELCNPASVADT